MNAPLNRRGFHVETPAALLAVPDPRCANPECRRKIDAEPMRESRGAAPRNGAGRPSERSFCNACWSRLGKGTRKRIIASHANRAGRLHTVRMAISQLRGQAIKPTNGGLR